MQTVVVVGASAAGLTAAESLRRHGFAGQIALLGDELELPYDRPPLSKQILVGPSDNAGIALRSRDQLAKLGLDLRLGTPAVALDVDSREVSLADGERLPFDGLVIATGVSPRTLVGTESLDKIYTLRTLRDAMRLRDALRPGCRLLIVGGGFLGTEVAATAVRAGANVTLVEPIGTPLASKLGGDVAEKLAGIHQSEGVDLRIGSGVRAISQQGNALSVLLSDGSNLSVDIVLVAVGSLPNTGWLAGSGLDIQDGVLCADTLMASDGIVAAGDVARWTHVGLGQTLRMEHRANATEQGRAAAATLLGKRDPFAPTPFFWSDQYDVKIQVIGLPSADCYLELLHGDLHDDRFAAVYREPERGTVVAAMAWNMPSQVVRLRKLIAESVAAPIPSSLRS